MSQQLWPELVSVNAIHHKSFLLQLPHEHLCFSRSDCLFALHTSILLQTDSLLTLITLFASFSLLIETSLSLFSLVIPSHSSTSNCASFLFWLCLDVFVIHILYEEPMLTADILFTYDNHTLKPSSDETMLNLELVDTLWAFFSETPLKITLLHKFFLLPLRTPIWSCLSLCPAIFWERSRSSCSSHRHELYPDVFYLWSFLVWTHFWPFTIFPSFLDHISKAHHASELTIWTSQISWSTSWPHSPRSVDFPDFELLILTSETNQTHKLPSNLNHNLKAFKVISLLS